MSTLPVSGWYEDPEDGTRERWWNGSKWTDLRREKPLPPPTVPDHRGSSAPASSNPWAIVGIVMGFVSLLYNPVLIPSTLGIVFSALGIARANSLGEATGQRVQFPTAVVGLTLSLVGAFLFLINVSVSLSNLSF
ncbi:DUF2510 domain-containing protein [Chryseoglobus sp. 28M-23]|nr:DUF2510 domain-containing protein [Chryseoglobus sp. 28M-23]